MKILNKFRNKLQRKPSLILFSFLILTNLLHSQSLWQDSNPYTTGQQGVRVGSILRVQLKDGIKADYTFESGKDETVTIKSAPDKKIVPEIMGYNYDRSIAAKSNGKEKSNSKILGTMAVQITEINEEGILIVSGVREVSYEKGKSSLKLTGKVSPTDIRGSTIPSDLVADLKLEYKAGPIAKEITDPDVQMKPALAPNGKPILGPDGQPLQKAELSENEKQKIILKNIRKLLGESE